MVKPRHEKTIARCLDAKGISNFLPLYEQHESARSRNRIVQLPLFPMYVFCQLDLARRMPALTVPGVLSIVSFGRVPACVDPAEIEHIRTLVGASADALPHPYIDIGEKVRVVLGPLQGLEGILTDVRGRFRLIVSLSLLKRSVSVEIDRTAVVPADPGPRRIPPVDPRPLLPHAAHSEMSIGADRGDCLYRIASGE